VNATDTPTGSHTEEVDRANLPASSAATATTSKFYIAQIHAMKHEGLSTLYVDFRHLQSHPGVLAQAIRDEYWRMLPYMLRALNNMIQTYEPQYYREHRQPGSTTSGGSEATSTIANASQDTGLSAKTVNQQTDKLFTLAFYNLPIVSRIRQLRTDEIGTLTSISGTVTRTSEVRPELHSGTFICEHCNTAVYNLEQIFRYTEPTQCPNVVCGNRESWRLDIKQSVFVDWQKIRVQENSSEIPTGSMPRTMDVIVRGEMVDRAKAGEKCIFTGTLIVVPDISQFRMPAQNGPPQVVRNVRGDQRGAEVGGSGISGLKALGVRDLTYRLAFLSCMITPDLAARGQNSNQQLEGQAGNILASLNQGQGVDPFATTEEAQKEYLEGLTAAEVDNLRQMVHMPNIYARLVDSLAPMVYGHEVVKKGLLLQLMGGVAKQTPEGMALRGDINVCIVGDPSTSKSQFLK
jgi:DNA replication licensing factor MCM6